MVELEMYITCNLNTYFVRFTHPHLHEKYNYEFFGDYAEKFNIMYMQYSVTEELVKHYH
jgi:hypothetical protein